MLILFLFPEASAQFASWLTGPFSSVLRMHSAVCSLSYREAFFLWPRLLIPHCKEQQLCFVCGGLCSVCSLVCQSHPSLCTWLFQLLKGWLSGLLLRKPFSGLWKSIMCDLFFFPQNVNFQELLHMISQDCVWLKHSWHSGGETFRELLFRKVMTSISI